MSKQFAVIGMGRFGSSLAKTLYHAGYEVLAIDTNEENIEETMEFVTHGIVADSTEESALKEIGIRNMDVVIVAIGDDIQASILTVLNLKELGVNYIVAKAQNERHGKVLYKVGADKVVFPERDMGERIANQLISPNVLDFIEIDKDYNIEEVKAPTFMTWKTLKDSNVRAKYDISVIAIKGHKGINVNPRPDEIIRENDILIVVGHKDDLKKFESEK